MQAYNVEIFDRDFDLIQHYNIDSIAYSFDYLSITENVICIPFNEDVAIGDYIRIKNDVHEFSGVISRLSVDEAINGFTNVAFKPFISLFDSDIIFDVTGQGSGSLEDAIGAYITAYFISNADLDQNIFGLSVESISETGDWTFYITEAAEGTGKAVINLVELLQSALQKYNVAVYITPDFAEKTLTCEIGDKQLASFTIEGDLPNVIRKSVTVNENKTDTNKLIVLDSGDMTTSITYYLHSDDSYDTSATDRIMPVVYEIQTASASGGKTFAEAAAEAADKLFGNNKKANLIEITIRNNDKMVNPDDLEIGQLVTVITNGKAYQSVFTGYTIETTTKLIFGTIRLDLTKILKEAIK